MSAPWSPPEGADREVVERICDRLHVYLTSSPAEQTVLAVAEETLEDLIAILHGSPVADFGSTGEVCAFLKASREGMLK